MTFEREDIMDCLIVATIVIAAVIVLKVVIDFVFNFDHL